MKYIRILLPALLLSGGLHAEQAQDQDLEEQEVTTQQSKQDKGEIRLQRLTTVLQARPDREIKQLEGASAEHTNPEDENIRLSRLVRLETHNAATKVLKPVAPSEVQDN